MSLFGDAIRMRERYGLGIAGNSMRAVVRDNQSNEPDNNLVEGLRESILAQLGEHFQDARQNQRDLHGTLRENARGSRSNHIYFGEPFSRPNFQAVYGDFDRYDPFRTLFDREQQGPSHELSNALMQAASNTFAEFNLRPEDIMFLLSPEAYEILCGGRGFVRDFMGIEINISYDQIDLYKVIIKGVRGYEIAKRRVEELR